MYSGRIFLLLLALVPAVFAETDYCNPKLCRNKQRHIGCKNDNSFGDLCENPKLIEITEDIQTKIVDEHNSLRNKIAQGFYKFPKAARMATMVWSDELAKLAEYNVKQCRMSYDECRNSEHFPITGQNIAVSGGRNFNMTVFDVIDEQIQNWFSEYKVCPLHAIKSFTKLRNRNQIKHFTAMIQENSNYIGCSIITFDIIGIERHLMTCNYAHDNIRRAPVYHPGQTASKCKSGTDTKFTSLCSVQERYFDTLTFNF